MTREAENGPRPRLLVADDEPTQREMLASLLGRAGFLVTLAADGAEAIERLESPAKFDLLLADQKMPRVDGLALLDRSRRIDPALPVVLMTAYGSVPDAVLAMKRGAADYIAKPFERDELLLVLEKTLRRTRLESEVAALREASRAPERFCGLVGGSPAMKRVFAFLERAAAAGSPVLLRGESGTGKELAARAIHALSRRARGPFVAVNCAAVPESLAESEFFGHEKGAFTGATAARAGCFEAASGGTLFLDEIGAMRADLQAKLLRALEEGSVRRVGAERPIAVDARVVSATSEDLETAVRERRFREDLYYRLDVLAVTLPPLRERKEDVPVLAQTFLEALQPDPKKRLRLAPALVDRLEAHAWPGNVRELRNCVERLVALARGPVATTEDLPDSFRAGAAPPGVPPSLELPPEGVDLEAVERFLIEAALARAGKRLVEAARLLGISYKTLQYRVKKFGL